MVYQHNTAEQTRPSSLPLMPMWATWQSNVIIDHRDLLHFSALRNHSSSSECSDLISGFTYTQTEMPDVVQNISFLDPAESYLVMEESVDAVDARYVSTGWMDGLRGTMDSAVGGLSSGPTITMNETWDGTGYTRDAILSSTHLTATASEILPRLSRGSLEMSVVEVGDEHVRYSACLGVDPLNGTGEFYNESDQRIYQNNQPKLESSWMGPTPCLLEGCQSKHLFPTFQSFISHIKNVHEKAVICSEPGCTFGRPFANNTDLKRHVNAVHKDKKVFKCQRQDCPQRVKAWSRKDKLRLHNQKHHSNFRCFFCSQSPRHQRWFSTLAELFAHTTSDHPQKRSSVLDTHIQNAYSS